MITNLILGWIGEKITRLFYLAGAFLTGKRAAKSEAMEQILEDDKRVKEIDNTNLTDDELDQLLSPGKTKSD